MANISPEKMYEAIVSSFDSVNNRIKTDATIVTGDIQIGAVELKDGTTDNRASISAAGAVKVDGSAVTQPVSGTVTATGPLTDTQLRFTSVPVSLASTTVTGSVAVTGPLTDTQMRASAVPISLATAPTTPVTGTFFQATQPVSIATMPSTPVTGTFYQATQPVSGTVTITPSGTQVVDTELPAAAALSDAAANPTTPVVGAFIHEFNGTTWDRKRSQFNQTTTGITATSNGAAIDMSIDPQKMFAITSTIVGDTSTFDVRLEGSLNNSNWTELVAVTNVTPGDGKLGFAIDKPVLYVRYRVAGITRVTGSLTIVILATE